LPNFKYYKKISSRSEAKVELIKQHIKNKLEIKNMIVDQGDHYLVKLPGGKNFLADKIDLPFIDAYVWFSSHDYESCNQNRRQIMFHNLILGHTPTLNATIDHINRCSLDNCRINLRIVTNQTQTIN